MSLIRGFTFLIIFLVCTPKISVSSDDLLYSESIIPLSEESKSFDKLLKSHYMDAVDGISKDDIRLVSISLSKIKLLADEAGFKNLPEFSADLIRRANDPLISSEMRKVLFDNSFKLSKNHPHILLLLASSANEIGYRKSVEYLKDAVSIINDYPITLWTTVSKISIIAISALFLILVLVVFILLVSSSGEIYLSLATMFSRSIRGFFALFLFPIIIFLPLVFPILVTISLWSIVIVLTLKRHKFLLLFNCFLILAFIYYLPFAKEVNKFSEIKIAKVFESISNGNYLPRLDYYLSSEVKQNPSNPLLQILLGKMYYERGNLDESRLFFEKALPNIIHNLAASYVVLNNIAVCAYDAGNYEEAYSEWQKLYSLGRLDFELLYNLSISSLLLFKKAESEKYYSQIIELYPSEYKNNFEAQGENPKPLIAKFPKDFFKAIFTIKTSSIKNEEISIPFLNKTLLYKNFTIFPFKEFYLSLVAFMLLIFTYSSLPGKKSYRYSGSLVTRRVFMSLKNNRYWMIVPFAFFLFEGKEVKFILLGFLLLFCILLGIGEPLSVVSSSLNNGIKLFYIPAIFFLIISLLINLKIKVKS